MRLVDAQEYVREHPVEVIGAIRAHRGWSLLKLSRELDCSYAAVYAWAQQRRKPEHYRTVARLARCYAEAVAEGAKTAAPAAEPRVRESDSGPGT
jgi:transcriptional regulator with XRE-family HTH domain